MDNLYIFQNKILAVDIILNSFDTTIVNKVQTE